MPCEQSHPSRLAWNPVRLRRTAEGAVLVLGGSAQIAVGLSRYAAGFMKLA